MNRLLISASRRSSGYHVAHCAARSKSSTASSLINKCPITGGGGGKTNSSSNLYNVPKLPFLGSFIPQYSGTDKFDLSKAYDWWYGNHVKFGNFYSIGLPGMGKGID